MSPDAPYWRRLADALPQIIWISDAAGNTNFFNARWYELTGADECASTGDGWLAFFHPEEREAIQARWQSSVISGEPYEIEYRLHHRDGSWRWQLGRGVPVRNDDGSVSYWVGTCTDIEALKAAEAQRALIASELSHRIRNIFAVIGALVSLSARSDPDAGDFSRRLLRRIGALATAHDFVRPAGDSPPAAPSLAGLLGGLLAPYQHDGEARVEIADTDMTVGPTAATALALIVHELATNAVKHGALGDHQGRVRLDIDRDGDLVRLVWRETGGPLLVGAPGSTGFGTQLSRHAMSAWPGARLEMDWVASGLVVTLTVPRDRLNR